MQPEIPKPNHHNTHTTTSHFSTNPDHITASGRETSRSSIIQVTPATPGVYTVPQPEIVTHSRHAGNRCTHTWKYGLAVKSGCTF